MSSSDIATGWTDPDEAPELTDEWFAAASILDGEQVVHDGRSDLATAVVTLRLDRDVLGRFREGGPGWQARINAALRKAAGL